MTQSREDGFTLLEALASVAVMAVLLASLALVAGQWLPNWRHGFLVLQSADLVGLALDRIAEDVASAEYARLDPDHVGPLFRGDPEAVMFVRRSIGLNAGPRLEIVRIGRVDTRQGVELERTSAAFSPGAIGSLRDPTTLLRPPARLTFAYAGPDGQWRSSWRADDKLPRAVRVSVSAGSGVVVSTAFSLKITEAPEANAEAEPAKPKANPDAPWASEQK